MENKIVKTKGTEITVRRNVTIFPNFVMCHAQKLQQACRLLGRNVHVVCQYYHAKD
jgi:hypothetical protein